LDKLKITAAVAAVGSALLVASTRVDCTPGAVLGAVLLLASPYISLFIVSRRIRLRRRDH